MKTIIILFFILPAVVCTAQQKIFTEEEFIAVIKKYHPVAKQAALDVRIAEAEVTASRGAFDPVFKRADARKDFDGITYYDQSQTEIKIPTWYGIDLYAGKENVTGSRINPEETKGTLSYLGISLPLVQNLLMDKRRAALQGAKVFRDLSEVQRRIVLNDLLREALKTYWDWWEGVHINQLMQSALANAEKRFVMVKTAYQLGDRPAIDTLEAFTQIQSFWIKQNEAFTELLKAQLKLSAFLWTDNDLQYDLPVDVAPQEWQYGEAIALDAVLASAAIHPELTQYGFKLESLRIDKRAKFQSLLPEVALKYQQIGYEFSKAVKAAPFQNDYRFGVSISAPLRLSEGRGEYRKAKLKIDQAKLEQTAKQVQVYNKIKQHYTEWQQTGTQVALQTGMITNVIVLQKGEETRFFNGESSLFLINARELRTIEAQQKGIEIRSKNRKALIELKWSTGLFGN